MKWQSVDIKPENKKILYIKAKRTKAELTGKYENGTWYIISESPQGPFYVDLITLDDVIEWKYAKKFAKTLIPQHLLGEFEC